MSQAPLPPVASADRVDVDNVQGDIILGLPKKKQEFIFFVIADSAKFKAAIPSLRVTSTGDVIRSREAIAQAKQANPGSLVPLPLLNIAFSRRGLDALGIKDDLGDAVFSAGQLADARNLGDEGKTIGGKFDPNWEQAFKTRIDAVLLVVGETWVTVNAKVAEALQTFGDSVRVVDNLKASVRPGAEKVRACLVEHANRVNFGLQGHEHFGWIREDGISNPAIKGIGASLPGQRVLPPGIIVTGKTGDTVRRPGWAVEGSFLAFRQLNQLVPEFHDFLEKNPIDLPGLDRKQGSELLGARLVGRWKSGAPIQLSPLHDDPVLAKDPQRNNNFVYPQDKGEEGQTACPYAAHIRKTNPRNDLDGLAPKGVERASMTRAGIPFGPEVTFEENEEKVTEHERGLAFVSYQSDLSQGFQFVQKSWANARNFPPQKAPAGAPALIPGFDPIIGQADGASRATLGTTGGPQLTLPRDFVVSRGGEYFFSPSIRALKTVFAGKAA
ncbi:hypothetical protein FRC10_009652 [Ceratobasidium sp. 414]|nr:hypothetical protein FRC10_009652 [Ceratobasidium sp. 414]